MKQWQEILGRYVLEITCADCTSLLNAFIKNSVQLKNVTYCSDIVLWVTIAKRDFRNLLKITEKHGATVKILHRKGVLWVGKSLLKRPVLVSLFCILFSLSIYLPSKVLFISVEGNHNIPTNQILEAAEKCGIRFGASRRQIRSEIMKNALLQEIPQLQWAGINTAGCTAVISVKEKTQHQSSAEQENQVCSIVAARDGIIQHCTVYQGNSLCTVGQAVKAGQTLVSGYLDCGIVTKATRADAEIQALTFRNLEAVTPAASTTRGELTGNKTKYSLQIGKKLINFSKDSGNSDVTCVKIYSENYVHLPGGFRIPVAIIKETLLFYEDRAKMPVSADSEEWLAELAQDYLRDTMIAGEVISAETELETDESGSRLYGRYACMEMIGQVKFEQTMLKDDGND